jgi:hypothetical protein
MIQKKAAKDEPCAFPTGHGGFLKWHPQIIQVIQAMDDNFCFETHSDLGIPQFKKPLNVANVALVKIEISTPALFFYEHHFFTMFFP